MDRTGEHTPIPRRRALIAGGVVASSALAGCTSVLDAVGDRIFEDVNVLNQLTRTVRGSVTVVDPGDETVLDRVFDVPSTEADGESNLVAYADIWTEPGAYEIRVELTNLSLEGVSQATRTVDIDDTTAEMVAVSIGARDGSEPIAIRVGESFSDIGSQNTTT